MRSIVNDPSFDLVSDQHTAAQWVLSAATGIERLAGGMSLAYIARLRDAWVEIERLRGLMAESPLLTHLAVEPGGRLRLEGTVPHWMARRVAESFFETLADAENFVIVHFDSEQGPIEVTVRRPGGKPVATVQAEQLAEIARLKAALAKWESLGPWYAIEVDGEPRLTGYVNASGRPAGVHVPLVCNNAEPLAAEAEEWGCDVVPFPAPEGES